MAIEGGLEMVEQEKTYTIECLGSAQQSPRVLLDTTLDNRGVRTLPEDSSKSLANEELKQ